jgi:hypothetical protein
VLCLVLEIGSVLIAVRKVNRCKTSTVNRHKRIASTVSKSLIEVDGMDVAEVVLKYLLTET